MRKLIYISVAVLGVLLHSCSDSFLDTEPLTQKTNTTFYESEQDMKQALTAGYFVLVDCPQDWILFNYPFVIAEILSDDRLGGMGDNDPAVRAMDEFKVSGPSMFEGMWKKYYQGIFRMNMLIENLDKATYSSEESKNQIIGEAYFLRGLFYFELVRMFENIPLVLESAPVNEPQADPKEVYAQIASDLKKAIETFPSTTRGELGRANKWIAEALMARVFLFYTGFYEQPELPLAGEEAGSVSKNQVVTWLEDVIDNSGYELMPDFRNLWPYALATSENSDEPFKYAEDNNLDWYGEAGENIENMFMLKFSTFADWGTSIYYSNQMNLLNGWRSYSYKGVFGEGWGMGTVNTKLWDEWPNDDLRKRASILNVKDDGEIAIHGVDNYGYGEDFHDKQMDETGLWQMKYRPVNLHNDGEWANYSVTLYGAEKDFQLDNMQDIVLIRYADVLLMHSELTETVEGINEVRDRVDLEPIGSYSLEALKKERRYELAFEGVRYHDVLRWAGQSNLQEVKEVIESQDGVSIINNGVQTEKSMNFRVETRGFIQIPQREISLSDGVLEQNPGWGPDAPVY
ncbi:RagB/SusD family nutrient uptake outer membrane protein [Anaerophaga thermohalophila]|uniref:RagB/SusD family nutrient uptake outer membrane protein n=1 Tax=Anaerophaga thermohalophila TaxID=177400 RepID=UPI00037E3F0C|nr:RagB/SusD family nutrient uptake outer membrane protein [Anaerophaga thermohalophila]